jgi:hypothetical protein
MKQNNRKAELRFRAENDTEYLKNSIIKIQGRK